MEMGDSHNPALVGADESVPAYGSLANHPRELGQRQVLGKREVHARFALIRRFGPDGPLQSNAGGAAVEDEQR